MTYDHQNYSRWGPVYLADMQSLPQQVKEEFIKGNFVVRRSSSTFNQVDPDHNQEWLNATGKSGGDIIGITKTTSALSRWALSYNTRSHIAADTRALFHQTHEDCIVHSECVVGRKQIDNDNEDSLFNCLERFNVLASEESNSTL